MAKSYAERNQASIQSTGKTLYQRRIENAVNRGFSTSQARGHARVARGEQPASVVTQARGGTAKAPPITKRFATLPSGTRVVQTRKTSQVNRTLSSKNAQGKRVYFSVFNPKLGEYVNVYYGSKSRTSPHGITVKEFNKRVRERQALGMTLDEAIRDTMVEDSSEGSGIDSPENEEVEYNFTNVTMYIR